MRAVGRYLVLLVLAITLAACDGSSSGKSKDTTAPVITLTGNNPQVIEAGTQYVELGATATDNRDGDLSTAIVIDATQVNTSVPGTYTVTYNVSDSAGNLAATATRTVICEDATPPVITLLGDNPQVIIAGNPYIELGATASDTLDGDLSAQIAIDAAAVNTLVAGDYTVTYDVTDAAGNAAATVTRTVRVELPPPPAAPRVSVGGNIKQLVFSWDAVATATYYRLLENPDGHSGFRQVGDNIAGDETSVARDIAVHLHDWVNALYLLQACNLGGCTDSTYISATGLNRDTIGYIKASNSDSWDRFGDSVALSGDGRTLAISADFEDSAATGIDGDQSDNSSVESGAVYVFRLENGSWAHTAYLKASNARARSYFGRNITLSEDGTTLAVGAYGESSAATGIDGDQSDQSAPFAGAVYIFRFDGVEWTQQAYIKASNTEAWDKFGYSVALDVDGDTLAVGAPNEDSSATGINGDQFDDRFEHGTSGAVYLYRFDGLEWTQEAYIKASNTGIGEWFKQEIGWYWSGHQFGAAVGLSADGSTLAVGAPAEDGLATGVNGDESNQNYVDTNCGAVYTFRFDGDSWFQEAYVKPSFVPVLGGWAAGFGEHLALSANGRVMAVAVWRDDSSLVGVNDPPLQIDSGAEESGAVHLFRFDGQQWAQESYIKASNPEEDDHFGSALGSIALSHDGNTLAIGAGKEDSAARGVGGDESDNSVRSSGAVYVFSFDGASWLQDAYLKSSNSEQGDLLGGADLGDTAIRYRSDAAPLALSADGTTLAVGAVGEDSNATGVNGDQTDNSAEGSGAVYVY